MHETTADDNTPNRPLITDDRDPDDSDDRDDLEPGCPPRSATATVYVDLDAGRYHDDETHAGDDPAAFTRHQAETYGNDPCPDCFPELVEPNTTLTDAIARGDSR